VLATVSDKKIQHSTDGTTIDYYNAEVVTANDYYPGGMDMPGRSYSIANTNYRYGFNGLEKSTEINGSENLYTAEFWEYDSRIVRRWNLDPINNGNYSPYSAFNNNSILFSDPLGLDTVNSNKKAGAGDVFQHQNGNSNFFWDKTKIGWEGGGESGNLPEIKITAKLKKPLNFLPSAFNYTKEQGRQMDIDQNNFRLGNFADLSSSQIRMYQRWDESYKSWQKMSLGIVGILAAPIVGAGAPGLFTVSTQYAAAKATLSFGFQATFNGVKNVDYIAVGADAFTAPGLDALINGFVNYRPFANPGNRLQIAGVNKSASEFAIDAGTSFFSGLAGNSAWRPLQPLLQNPTERTVFFLPTQAWLNAGTQGANKIIKDKSNENK
jgi:hypothetical protein